MIGHATGKIYIVDAKRTPFGKFGGSLSAITPIDLAVYATKGLFQALPVPLDSIDQVIFANVIPSTPDTLYAGRHLALKCGMPTTTPGYVINRLCGSGLHAILDAARLIRTNEAQALLVAGAENLSMAPQLIYGSRFGTKYGPLPIKDLLLETLSDQYIQTSMGMTAENLALEYNISREEADNYSFNSHQKANHAYQQGLLADEIVPVLTNKVNCTRDEHLRADISLEELSSLKSTFKTAGTVTAGSASGIVDGACAMLVAGEAYVKRHQLKPLAEILDGQVVGVDPSKMGIGPVPATGQLLAKNSMNIGDIDFFEINEAFASQVLACQRGLAIPAEKLNRWGGAVALGHPLGATGIKIAVSLARQLRCYNKEFGIASACIGGGQGIALLIRRV